MRGLEVVQLAGGFDDVIDPRITELDYFSRVHVDQMVMLHTVIGLFKLGNVLAELMLDHQVAV